MNRHWYLFITLSASVLVITVTSLVLSDIIMAYRQRNQADWLIHRARDYFCENGLRRSDTEEMAALRDIVTCYEMSLNYRKKARKKDSSSALPNQNTLA